MLATSVCCYRTEKLELHLFRGNGSELEARREGSPMQGPTADTGTLTKNELLLSDHASWLVPNDMGIFGPLVESAPTQSLVRNPQHSLKLRLMS